MWPLLIFYLFLHSTNGQFAEIASLATSLLGSGLGPALGGAASAGSAAAPGALGALSQIGQLYQLAQGALQLTGTGVGVLNQASEGNWFPAALESASKSTRNLMSGMGVGGFAGPPNLGALGPRNTGNQIGPEFGTGFPAPSIEDYEDNSVNGAATTKKAETLVNIDDDDDFDEFTNPPTTPSTPPPAPITLLPIEPESNSVTEPTTAATLKEIRVELPKAVEEQTDSDYIDEVKTDGNSRIQVTNKVKSDGDENLLSPDVRNIKLRNGVPNLPKLIEVLRKSNLKDSDISEIISQIEDNENVPSPPKIDFTSAVQNIPLKKHQNRERIVKASRELQKNIGPPEQEVTNQFNQLAELSVATGVPPTTFQPPSTATLPGLNHLFPHLTQPPPDPIASNRLQREISSIPTDKVTHPLPLVTSTPGFLSTQAQFTTPVNFFHHHQHWPHPHYPTQYNSPQPSPPYQPHPFAHQPFQPFVPYQHYQQQQQQGQQQQQQQQQAFPHLLQQNVQQQQQQQQQYYPQLPQQSLQQYPPQQQQLAPQQPPTYQYQYNNHPQYSTQQVSSAPPQQTYRQFKQVNGQTYSHGGHVVYTNQPPGEYNPATFVALSAKTQQSKPAGIQAPSRAVRTNAGNAAPNQPHSIKTRNAGSTAHHQLVEVRLPRMSKKTGPAQNSPTPYRVDRSGAAVHLQRRYPVRTVATQRITTPSPRLRLPDGIQAEGDLLVNDEPRMHD